MGVGALDVLAALMLMTLGWIVSVVREEAVTTTRGAEVGHSALPQGVS